MPRSSQSGGLGREQGVDGGAGGFERTADELYVPIDALDIALRLLVLPQFDEAENHLHVVFKIMALGAQRAIEVFELGIGVFQHLALAGDLAGVPGIADVQKRAPDHYEGHDADKQAFGYARQIELTPKKGIEHQPNGKKYLRRVRGDGIAGNFVEV